MSPQESTQQRFLDRKEVKLALAALMLGSLILILGWKLGLLLMVGLTFHEYAHIGGMKYCGMRTKGVWFIPFLGAVAVPADEMPSRRADVFISIMGPVGGLLPALLCAGVYLITREPFWAMATALQAMLNLFNLLPVYPLDGGRIGHAVAASIDENLSKTYVVACLWVVGFLAIFSGQFLFWMLLVIAFLGSSGIILQTRLRQGKEMVLRNLACEEQYLKILWMEQWNMGAGILLPAANPLEEPVPLDTAVEAFEKKREEILKIFRGIPPMDLKGIALSLLSFAIVTAAFVGLVLLTWDDGMMQIIKNAAAKP